MATYQAIDVDQLNQDLTSIAQEIRKKQDLTGEDITTPNLTFPDGFVNAIENLFTGKFSITIGKLSNSVLNTISSGGEFSQTIDSLSFIPKIFILINLSSSSSGTRLNFVTTQLPNEEKWYYGYTVRSTYGTTTYTIESGVSIQLSIDNNNNNEITITNKLDTTLNVSGTWGWIAIG